MFLFLKHLQLAGFVIFDSWMSFCLENKMHDEFLKNMVTSKFHDVIIQVSQ